MTADRPDLDGLREKAEKTTPAGWEKFQRSAAYMAAADPTTVLALIARVEKAEGAVAELRLLAGVILTLAKRRDSARADVRPAEIMTALLAKNSGHYYLDDMAQEYVEWTKRRALGADS